MSIFKTPESLSERNNKSQDLKPTSQDVIPNRQAINEQEKIHGLVLSYIRDQYLKLTSLLNKEIVAGCTLTIDSDYSTWHVTAHLHEGSIGCNEYLNARGATMEELAYRLVRLIKTYRAKNENSESQKINK